MIWQKLGQIKIPFEGLRNSHTQIPITYEHPHGHINILYASRDELGISRTFKITLNSQNLLEVVGIDKDPVLNLGENGTFDDSGVMPTWVTTENKKLYLYYIGWNKKVSVPYQNSIGLAISSDGNSFNKYSEGPLLDRSIHDPCFVGTACVLKDEIWKMWYLSCTEWVSHEGKLEPRYHLKYAESVDGINWKREGRIAIDYKSDAEGGIAKASVIKIDGVFHMWFCYRGVGDYRTSGHDSYRIGYATSVCGLNWDRQDSRAGIDVGETGWDSEMICYPHVFNFNKKVYMLYNGNRFGCDGIGLAELKND